MYLILMWQWLQKFKWISRLLKTILCPYIYGYKFSVFKNKECGEKSYRIMCRSKQSLSECIL